MAWARLDPTYVPAEIDTTVPSVARVYDAILGGKDNFAVDRAVADEAMRTMADGGNGARLNRAALGRAVRYMADRGVSQFLDLGSGLPAAQNTHQIAQAANPEARVVYVDNDPSVSLHGQALLTGDDSTVVVLADVRSPDELLALPAVAGLPRLQPADRADTQRGDPPPARRGGPARHRRPLPGGARAGQLHAAHALLRRVRRGAGELGRADQVARPGPGAEPAGDRELLRRPRPGGAGRGLPALLAPGRAGRGAAARGQHADAGRGGAASPDATRAYRAATAGAAASCASRSCTRAAPSATSCRIA